MKKALFAEKQDAVRITTIDGKSTVQICQNEQESRIESQETGEVEAGYMYDYNEWVAPEEDVDADAIKKDPAAYLDYTPTPELTDAEKADKALAISELAVILAGGTV